MFLLLENQQEFLKGKVNLINNLELYNVFNILPISYLSRELSYLFISFKTSKPCLYFIIDGELVLDMLRND